MLLLKGWTLMGLECFKCVYVFLRILVNLTSHYTTPKRYNFE